MLPEGCGEYSRVFSGKKDNSGDLRRPFEAGIKGGQGLKLVRVKRSAVVSQHVFAQINDTLTRIDFGLAVGNMTTAEGLIALAALPRKIASRIGLRSFREDIDDAVKLG